jgi:hypothetical protein
MKLRKPGPYDLSDAELLSCLKHGVPQEEINLRKEVRRLEGRTTTERVVDFFLRARPRR